jgi:heptosyltransferase-2/heptosyltransferase-3
VRDESIERVVVVFPGALGDLLLALPTLRVLRARHPRAHVTGVVNDWLAGLVQMAGIADDVASLTAPEAAWLFGGSRPPAWLAGRPHVYSWLGADDRTVRARLAAVAGAVSVLRVERGTGTLHATAAYARAVGATAGLRALARGSHLVPAPSARADTLLARLEPPRLALHPGAGARAKRWDAAGFVQVAEWWRAQGGAILEIAGPAEAGEPSLLGGCAAREWPLAELATVLGRVDLYVGNDSGISHLAAAVGAPGVVLFGPTDPRRWRPLSPRVVALRARTSGPDGIPLASLPAPRVIAACRRRVALTRGGPEISVGP